MIEKQVGHGDATIEYGSERPRYGALRRQIDSYYADLLRSLGKLQGKAEIVIGVAFTKAEDGEPFRYIAARRRLMDDAISTFLDELAGPDRTQEGFVAGGIESDTPDGIIQQHDILSFAVGLQRGSDLMNYAQTVTAGRNNPATEKMLENAFARLSQGGQMRLEEVRDDIHGILAGGAEAGLSPLSVARQLSDQFDQYSRYEFQRLARTEAAYASEEGVREQLVSYGVDQFQVLVDASACSICLGYASQVIPADGDLPPYHPNCCIGGTVVSGPRALASTERWYVGEVIEIRTGVGYVLTVTPNHPILTPKGWVAAGLLNEGDHVITSREGEVKSVGHIIPDDYQIPALIEDVARALRSSLPVSACTVPTSPEDFHGDGLGSEVCVVRTNGELRRALNAPQEQPIPHRFFCYRHAEALGLSRAGSGAERLVAVSLATDGGMGSAGHLHSSFGGAGSAQSGLDSGGRVQGDASFSQDARDHATPHLKVPSERELVSTGLIATDHILSVNRRVFRGHVFNLQTNCGWFIANNIITHNCLCASVPAGIGEGML